jgi:hypothetical protein
LGIKVGLTCLEGFSVRTGVLGGDGVVTGYLKYELKEARVGDIWENPTEASHVGIVRSVESDKSGAVVKVQVEHDSSAHERGVVKSWFDRGDFYRPPT